jgi:hypothetical protein
VSADRCRLDLNRPSALGLLKERQFLAAG